MGDYKQLNRELIDTNRELKQLVATLQKEIVLMRTELMEQHRIRVEAEYNSRERLLTSLAKNFLASIKDIDSNVNVMNLLGYKDCIQTTYIASVGGQSEQSGSTRTSRRSTQLVRDFRRTSAVCRQQSVVQMSPTRRGVHEEDAQAIEEGHAIEEEENEEWGDISGIHSGSEMDLDNSINSDNVIDVDENDESAEEKPELGCINESSEEEEVLNGEVTSKGPASHTKRQQKPLRDLSNQMRSNEDKTCKSNFITKRGKQREHVTECENSIEMARDQDLDYSQTQGLVDMDVEEDLVNSMQRSLHVSRSDFHESTIRIDKQHQVDACGGERKHKHVVVRLHRIHEPVQQTRENNINEDTIIPQGKESLGEISRKNDELSLGITEFSMGNFLEASCSTPCHSVAARAAPAPAPAPAAKVETAATKSSATRTDDVNANSFDTSLSQSQMLSRPSRRCTPRSLIEPSLREKLRSESGGKKRSKSRKR